MSTIDKIPYEKRIDVDVDVPANLGGTYKEATVAVEDVYTKLSALNTIKLCNTSFKETLTSLMQGDASVSKQIESTTNVVVRIAKAATPAINTALDKFAGKFEYKKHYQDVFLSNAEWVEVRKTLMNNLGRLQDIKQMTEYIEELEGTLREIARLAESADSKLTQKDLKNMGETAKNVALILDAYGMASTRQMALEHNYILCANHLYDVCK